MVKINGVEYEPKSLTLPQIRSIRELDENESDIRAIAWSLGCSEIDIREWFNRVSMGTAQAVINAVLDVSALTEDAQFPGEAADDVVDGGGAQ